MYLVCGHWCEYSRCMITLFPSRLRGVAHKTVISHIYMYMYVYVCVQVHVHVHVSYDAHSPADFWDTAGQERFNSMHSSYYHQAHACILVSQQVYR